jgi:hypothetical protein
MSLNYSRKLKLTNTSVWPHHRGGWRMVVNAIYDSLRVDDGTLFVPVIEEVIAKGEIIAEPWVGFVHQVPKTELEWHPDLERLIARPGWQSSLPYCRGIFTLSGYVRDYLIAQGVRVPIDRILYPADRPTRLFSPERYLLAQQPLVLFVGEYLRNHQAFFDLCAPQHQKVLLRPSNFGLAAPADVQVLDRVTDDDYDTLLAHNIVFINLLDAPANTIVVECIMRNTPLLINRQPGVVEYLGEHYPLYYERLDEAEAKLSNNDILLDGFKYLCSLPIKKELTPDAFIASLARSAIYRAIRDPKDQS